MRAAGLLVRPEAAVDEQCGDAPTLYAMRGRYAKGPLEAVANDMRPPIRCHPAAKGHKRRAPEIMLQAIGAWLLAAPPATATLRLETMRHAPSVGPSFE